MLHPVISVIMPVYNADRYVARALESVLDQTFRDFEFLIIDDGSTDRSLEILRSYESKDQRIRLVSRPNTGLVVALNEMLTLANGEFIARMDSDDISSKERFIRQLDYLKKCNDCVCVGSWTRLIDEEDRPIGIVQRPSDHATIEKDLLSGCNSVAHPTVMFRSECVRSLNGYACEAFPAEDLDLWLRMSLNGKLHNIQEPLLDYRVHASSVSQRHRDLQKRKVMEVCQKQLIARGMEISNESVDLPLNSDDQCLQLGSSLHYGWMAFNHGYFDTSLRYSCRAIAKTPFRKECWALLVKSAVRKLLYR